MRFREMKHLEATFVTEQQEQAHKVKMEKAMQHAVYGRRCTCLCLGLYLSRMLSMVRVIKHP